MFVYICFIGEITFQVISKTTIYRPHSNLGSDVPFQLFLTGRPCIFGLLAEYFRIYRVQSLVYGYLVGVLLNVFFGLS